MGPYATQILGDYGADVIKVEGPEGDITRQARPARSPNMGYAYLTTNRSKRAITLDLKKPSGRTALLKLIASADVFVTNIRPRARERLGLDYDQLAALCPRLIYVSLVGYSQAGPYADRPAYDDLIQGMSGISYAYQVASGKPSYIPSAMADRTVGLSAAIAILAAVVEREHSGMGQKVEVPMFETMASLVMGDHMGGLVYDPPLDRGGNARHLSPDRRPYSTKDGYICALIYNDAQWRRFFLATGRPELPAADPRFKNFATRLKHIDEIYAELGATLETKTTAEWLEIFSAADIPAMPMHSFSSLMRDPHLVATGFFEPVEHPSEGAIRQMGVPTLFSRTPARVERLAPLPNQHAGELLQEVGLSSEALSCIGNSDSHTAIKHRPIPSRPL
jgi:crotonobetainyl-CoA:carnitine CoA-transferase CaiB-like acyl-CoA transferase